MRGERLAKERLCRRDSDIALLCSLPSETSFTKAFVRSLGISPARYRRTERCPSQEVLAPQPSEPGAIDSQSNKAPFRQRIADCP
jgi:AraC-like DNA-binding protein